MRPIRFVRNLSLYCDLQRAIQNKRSRGQEALCSSDATLARGQRSRHAQRGVTVIAPPSLGFLLVSWSFVRDAARRRPRSWLQYPDAQAHLLLETHLNDLP